MCVLSSAWEQKSWHELPSWSFIWGSSISLAETTLVEESESNLTGGIHISNLLNSTQNCINFASIISSEQTWRITTSDKIILHLLFRLQEVEYILVRARGKWEVDGKPRRSFTTTIHSCSCRDVSVPSSESSVSFGHAVDSCVGSGCLSCYCRTDIAQGMYIHIAPLLSMSRFQLYCCAHFLHGTGVWQEKQPFPLSSLSCS